MDLLLDNKIIIPIGNGGFIKGLMHKQGGVPVIYKNRDNHYHQHYEFEGYEFIVNHHLSIDDLNIVNQLNIKYPIHNFDDSNLKIPQSVTLIDVSPIVINETIY